ncbi:MAG TPA: cupredoxin domain-containing protein [Candidatus Limnocylindria bacterium]|nr:cupredoxin domain-containing protein [Candidatus Limnocylindria bacterium]
MTLDQILVTAIGALAIAGVAAFFLLPKSSETRAILGSSGFQEAMILVKGGYTPDLIVADAGAPIRLTFLREESGACSERVVFADFHKSAELPEGQQVSIDLPAAKAGEYLFQCGMGMLRGKLVVR